MYNTLHSTELKSLWENTAVPVSLADAIILRGKKEWFPKQNKAKGNTASVGLLLFDIFPPRKTVYFYNGLFQQSRQIHKHHPVRHTAETQMADTALTYRPFFTPAGLVTKLLYFLISFR